jgi:hypothetical protein
VKGEGENFGSLVCCLLLEILKKTKTENGIKVKSTISVNFVLLTKPQNQRI